MSENGSDALPVEPPEQENTRLREENARLRRIPAAHSIPIPRLAPEYPPPTKTVEPAPHPHKAERARNRVTLLRSVFRGREDIYVRDEENDEGWHGYASAALQAQSSTHRSASIPSSRNLVGVLVAGDCNAPNVLRLPFRLRLLAGPQAGSSLK